MINYAKIEEVDGNKKVVDSIVLADEQADSAAEFISQTLGLGGEWLRCSYEGQPRSKNGMIGDTYDPERGVFIPPKPDKFPSFVFNEGLWKWMPPVPHPADRYYYFWDEENVRWVKNEKATPVPASWVYDSVKSIFVPPVSPPTDGKRYRWDEPTISWVEIHPATKKTSTQP